ncbi:precorrin-6A synthase (deacetylating) [Granulicella sp. S190]|uniref:precorrin-6A synthase (deacetylating) n=1 Tax=Granulicella sp. S190 TaxID=1747226 RepID=UPI00131C285A|nr:precorrin-6A synthase (deacetylating) [Granulicella sp. S190]
MRKLYVIGIGSGNPEHITIEAIRTMNLVDVFFVMSKGEAKSDLVRLRKDICERYIDKTSYRTIEVVDPERDPSIASYVSRVEVWHEQRTLIWEALIENELKEDQCGAILVWGDPALYDSTLRVIDRLTARNKICFEYEVIPGITSVQALAARHKIMLNGIGESIHITTGRQLSTDLVHDLKNVVVMLDGECAFEQAFDKDVEIYWGAYVGTDKEILLSGKLIEKMESIKAIRQAARVKNGWIMDIYLLRNSASR